MRVGEKDCHDLTKGEEEMVAYPFPEITFAGSGSWSEPGRGNEPYKAPNGKYFTVRDLGDAFANFDHYCRGAHHSCFTGCTVADLTPTTPSGIRRGDQLVGRDSYSDTASFGYRLWMCILSSSMLSYL